MAKPPFPRKAFDLQLAGAAIQGTSLVTFKLAKRSKLMIRFIIKQFNEKQYSQALSVQ